jgi:hypothetical protein
MSLGEMVTDKHASQRIGPIRGSSRIAIEQRGDGTGSQDIAGIEDSDDVHLRQLQGQAGDLTAEAAELVTLLATSPVTADEIRALVDESIGAHTITSADVAAARTALPESGRPPELSAALNALATAVSITAGGLTLAAIGNPVALAVAAPLTLGLAGIIGLDAVRSLFQRIRKRLLKAD